MKESQAAAAAGVVSAIAVRGTRSLIGDYVALAKPRLNMLVVATSAASYYLGTSGAIDLVRMALACTGTALVAGGAAALNQVFERDTDALMRRTRRRPVPGGRVGPDEATIYGLALSGSGILLLATHANVLAAALALLTVTIYLTVYTPMKRRTPLATLVGAVPGALPALIGWSAAHGSVAWGGAALFAIVFLWQIPHFMAISWMYRDDYGRAGFPMLAVIEPDGRRAGRQALLYAAVLMPVALVPSLILLAGAAYSVTAAVLGVGLLWLSARFARMRSDEAARHLFFASIIYLPVLWIALVADKL
jgi:protoheme IX farnesyltransferase